MKRECRKCKRNLPLTPEFYFKNKMMKCGFLKTCRECQGHRFYKKEVVPEGKIKCATCELIFNINDGMFHKCSKNKTGYKSSCKQCRSKKAKKYRSENREIILNREKLDRLNNPKKHSEWSKKYYEKVKNTKEYKKKQREWWECYYDRHRERLVEANRRRYSEDPEKYIRTVQKYQSTPKGQLSLKRNNHKRRQREQDSLKWFSENDWLNCINEFKCSCCYCGVSLEKPTMEHFVPLSKGGEFSPKNILPSCLSCNSSKSDSSFFDWYPKKEFYCEKRKEKILNYLKIEDNKQQMAFF